MKDILSLSKLAIGKALEGTFLANPEDLIYPFSKAYEILFEGGKREEIISRGIMSQHDLKQCEVTAKVLFDETLDYNKLFREARWRHETAETIQRLEEKLRNGEDVYDVLPRVEEQLRRYADTQTAILRADEIMVEETLRPIGWNLLDAWHIPTTGIQLITGRTGLGKSFFAGLEVLHILDHYEEEMALVLSLEMSVGQWKGRMQNMYPALFNRVKDRLYISDSIRSVQELERVLAVDNKFKTILIDYIDFFVPRISPEAFHETYNALVRFVRNHDVLVIVIAQPSRMENKSNKFLNIHSASWSSGAENAADQMLAVQSVRGDDFFDGTEFPKPSAGQQYYYVINLKQRAGLPKPPFGMPQAQVLEKTRAPMWEWPSISNFNPIVAGDNIQRTEVSLD